MNSDRFALSDAPPIAAPAGSVPDSFLVLPTSGTLQQDGMRFSYQFSAEELQEIAARSGYAAEKSVPVDFEHALATSADTEGSEESELNAALPGVHPACGYLTLSASDDGIIATVIKWTDQASQLIRQGAYRFFSPCIRGIQSGQPRITSVALTNTPALDQIQPLTLTAEKQTETPNMDLEQLQQIAGAFGIEDEVALSDADGLFSTIVGKAKAAHQLEEDHLALSAELKEIRDAEEAAEKTELIAKMPESHREWAADQDTVTLSSFLKSVKPAPPVGRVEERGDDPDVNIDSKELQELRNGFGHKQEA